MSKYFPHATGISQKYFVCGVPAKNNFSCGAPVNFFFACGAGKVNFFDFIRGWSLNDIIFQQKAFPIHPAYTPASPSIRMLCTVDVGICTVNQIEVVVKMRY